MYYPNEFREFIKTSNLEALEALLKDADLARQCWAKAAYADVRSKMVLETEGGERRVLIQDFLLYGEVLEAKLPDDVPGRDVLIQHCQLKQAELMLVRHPRIDASFTKEKAHTSLRGIIGKTENAEIKHGAIYLVARILLEGGQALPRNLASAVNLLDYLSKTEGVSPPLKAKAVQLIAIHRGIANEYAQMMRALSPPNLPSAPPIPRLVPPTNLPPHMSFAPAVALADQHRAQQQMPHPPMPPVAPIVLTKVASVLPGAQKQMSQSSMPPPPPQVCLRSARLSLPGTQPQTLQPSMPPFLAPPAAAPKTTAKRKTADEEKNQAQGQAQKEATASSSAKPSAALPANLFWVSTAAKPSAKGQPEGKEKEQKRTKKEARSDVQLEAPASSTAGMMQTLGHTTPIAAPANPPAAIAITNAPAAAEPPRNGYNTATEEDVRQGALALAALDELLGVQQQPKRAGL